VTDPCASRHVEIKEGEQTVAAAQVAASEQAGGTVRVSLHAASGHVAPGTRAMLVDAVLDLPEVRASARLRVTVPLGDTESLWRLRERTEDAATRPAGSTALVDADILPGC
jgi:alpha-D-ribose 1-methylphosphonate 5-triphosphate synthase subunit PhnG